MRREVAAYRRIRLFAITAILALTACAGRPPAATGSEAAPSQTEAPQATLPAFSPSPEQQSRSAPTGCTAPAEPSPSMTEGPYFKPGSPERRSLLEPETVGERLVLSGFVLTPECEPVANALLDFWQADGNGEYDNSGFRLRGHQFTDSMGRYELTTVLPSFYGGRTAHIHVKVAPPGSAGLTTQLFFPGVERNQTDAIFDERLVVGLSQAADGYAATFNFIVRAP